jgi:hypothetical protein
MDATYTFSHDGVTFTVQPAEQGRHTVVFVNGLFGGGWIWEPVVATLKAQGYGTVVTAEPLAAHETAEDIPALLQSISLLVDTLPDPRDWNTFARCKLDHAERVRAAQALDLPRSSSSGAPGLGDEQDADSFGSALRTVTQARRPHRRPTDPRQGTDHSALVERCTEALTPRIMLRAGRALRATRGYDARPYWAASILPSSSSAAPATR